MSASDAFITFYTLLLGLGVAALLTGFARVLRRKRLREIGMIGLLLCVLIVFEFLSGWAGALRTFRNVDADIASLVLPFGTGACYFMAEVRAGVDDVDRRIVTLLQRRFGYMNAAARIKPDRSAVRDEWRKADVLAKVDGSAADLGVDRQLMARLYEDLIETSIAHELEVFDRTRD